MDTFNNGEIGSSVRTKINAAITEIGTAKSASPTDTTEGRLLKVGDYGAGAAAGTTLLGTGNTPIQPNATNLLVGTTASHGAVSYPLQKTTLYDAEAQFRADVSGVAVFDWSSNRFTSASLVLGKSPSGAEGNYSSAVLDNGGIGAIMFNGADGTKFALGAMIEARGDGTWSTTSTPTNLTFSTSNSGSNSPTERLRIDASGSLLVGTTITTANLLSQTSGIGFGVNGETIAVNRSDASSPIWINKTSYSSGASDVIRVATNGSIVGGLRYDGTDVALYQSSDARLKESITDHESELSNVMSLRPVRFNWRDGHGPGEGFIAQELEETAWADLVSEGDDGFKQVSGLGRVNTRLIKAIQEQQQLIESLQSRIEALENQS